MSESHVRADGSTLRVRRPPRARPADAARVTRAEINLAHLRHNLRELEASMAADGEAARRPPAQVWAVLKADAYGHGASVLGVHLERAGVDGICVALLEEGIELRQAGVRCPILVMGGYYGRYRDGLEALVEHELSPVVYDPVQLERLATAVRFVGGAPHGVHLKVDTGMGRLGCREDEFLPLLRALRRHPELRLDALMTHLACADEPDPAITHDQLRRFDAAQELVRRQGLRPVLRHAANSAAALRFPDAQLDLVRPGIALHGVHPCPTVASSGSRVPKLKPVMQVLTEIVALRDLRAGEAIGYGHTWRAERPSRIATLPIGYADGFSRALSNRGHVLLHGQRVPIAGSVSMDLTMIDVTDIADARLRDEVVVLGEQRGRAGEDRIDVAEWAALEGTITWECYTGISRRVPRFYRHP
ncbi:MAG: alanine racemase [Myxococcota bacterium]